MKAKTILINSARAATAFLFAMVMAVSFTACSDKDDDPGDNPDPEPTSTTETVMRTVAVVAPTSDATLKTRLERTADWFQEKFKAAQGNSDKVIELKLEWYDELTEDLTSLSKTLASRSDLVAVIGPFGNDAVNTFASAMKKKQKALIAPTCTSEDVQRSYAISSSTDPNAGNPFFWALTQCDTRFSEHLMDFYAATTDDDDKQNFGLNAALITPDDKFGKTFNDWVPYYAENNGVEMTEMYSYGDDDDPAASVTDYLEVMQGDESAEGVGINHCVVETLDDLLSVARERRKWILSQPGLVIADGTDDYENEAYDQYAEQIEAYIRTWFIYNVLSEDALDDYSSRDKAMLEYYQGFSLYANPATGFIDAYNSKYGTKPIFAECKFYDALLLVGLATILYEEKTADSTDDSDDIDNGSINDCIWEIGGEFDSDDNKSDPIWDTDNMKSYLSSLKAGKAAPHSFHGATTYVVFDSETTSQLVRPTFLHWQIKDGEPKHLSYIAPDATTMLSDGDSWTVTYDEDEANAAFSEMADDSDPDIEYSEMTAQYAVLVHGSKSFSNYRHQADVLNVYQLLRKNGFDDDHIILIIDKSLANDEQNDEPGVIRISEDGQDLLGGTDGLPKAVVDYDAADLSPDDISNILCGISSDNLPVVLPQDAGNNVLFYWSGHGSKGEFTWRDADEGFSSDRLKDAAKDMTFRKLFIVAEPCYGESVINGIKGIEGVLGMSGASESEQSWADNWNSSMLIWMCDRFTKNVVNFLSENTGENYNSLYNYTMENTLGSHTKIVNSSYFGNLYKETPDEFFVKK